MRGRHSRASRRSRVSRPSRCVPSAAAPALYSACSVPHNLPSWLRGALTKWRIQFSGRLSTKSQAIPRLKSRDLKSRD